MFSGRRKHLGYLTAALATLLLMAVWIPACTHDDDDDDPVQSRFVVTTDTDGDNITIFKIDGSTGELTNIDNVSLNPDDAPTMIARHPRKPYVYLANSNAKSGSWMGDGHIRAAGWDPSMAIGNELADSPYLPGSFGNATLVNMAITPNGKYLYAGDIQQNEIVIFRVLDNGALLETSDSPVAAGGEPHGIALHRSGKFLFVGHNDIRVYGIADNGALTEVPNSPYSSNGYNLWLTVTPKGMYLFGMGNGDLNAYSIDQATGDLTALPGFPILTNLGEKGSTVTPSGKFLYTANFSDDSVGAYAVADNGALTAVVGQPYDTGDGPKNVSVTRNGKYLYVANYYDASVEAFRIDSSTGALTRIATYPTGGAGPKYLTTLP